MSCEDDLQRAIEILREAEGWYVDRYEEPPEWVKQARAFLEQHR